MQLPVNVNALLGEVTDVSEAREASVALSVYIDETAPTELAAHVRSAFASSSGHVRMTVTYVGDGLAAHPADDVAVVVAGETGLAGKQAAAVRAVGVPVMVVTLAPGRIGRVSANAGKPIPEGDIVAPWDQEEEGLVFDEQAAAVLDERMGRWITAVCRGKRLALAVAFPFVRRPLAKDAVLVSALENAGIGLLPIIPGADLPVMTMVQAKMALQIAAAYGKDMDKSRLKELAAVVGGAYLSRSLARKLVAAIPFLGVVFKTGIAYGSTLAMGNAIIEYFEGGEDMTGVANVVEKASETGTRAFSFVQEKVAEYAPMLSEITQKVQNARG